MIDLTLILSGQAYERLTFESFTRLMIGRSHDCEIQVDNLAISRRHAEIVNVSGVHVLRVIGKNETFVNGSVMETHNLNDGDLISIGKFTIAYSNDDPWSAASPTEGDRAMSGAAQTLIGTEHGAKARQESFQRVPAYLEHSDGKPEPLEHAYYLFGKSAEAEFRLRKIASPRCAAILLREDNGYRIVDLSPKKNQVKINDALTPDHRLSDDDEIVVGGHRLTFHHGRPGPDGT